MGNKVVLDVEKVLNIIKPDGLLSRTLKGFESRPQQQQMMSNILEAYLKNGIALIEAGTGTGKSIAYLIPALVWASVRQERTVISTHTINLQEQLVYKDIPLLLKALDLKLKVVLVKGMNNYVCIRKVEDAIEEAPFFPSEENEEITKIDAWQKGSQTGSRTEIPFVPSMGAWDRAGAEADACPGHECPHHQSCFFFKARRHAADAQILVVNHALLLADLAKRAESNNYTEAAILPAYGRIILDEAHHIEEMATEFFAERVHRMQLMRTLGRLSSEKNTKTHGKLPVLKDKLHSIYNKTPPRNIGDVIRKLSLELPALRLTLNEQIHTTFETYLQFLDHLNRYTGMPEEDTKENKLRLLKMHQVHQKWKAEVSPETERLIFNLKQYQEGINGIENDLKNVDDDRLQEQTKGIRTDIMALANRIGESSDFLRNYIAELEDPNTVRWMESQNYRSLTNVHLVDADLDVSKALVDYLFSKFPTVVLCSATLTTNRKFDFYRQRLGLTEQMLPKKNITENIYESPFDFKKQAILVVPTDIPLPSDPNFVQVAQEHILKAVQVSRGNAFILFTSYTMLQQCYEKLLPRLEAQQFKVFRQGDTNRQDLLNQFKQTKNSILMGTDSFWEGVDVAGDALRCVVIVKLPFRVPSEPILQARAEAILARGGDPFYEYTVPHAIVKFKQGFGRLIRNKWDRGCIVCLDTRLVTKNYGNVFLNSLPHCDRFFGKGEQVYPKMAEFYHKTYYLVQQNPANVQKI